MNEEKVIRFEDLTAREQLIKSMTLQGNGEAMVGLGFHTSTWERYGKELEDLVLKHDWYFKDYKKGQMDFNNIQHDIAYRAGETYTDNWGCVWENVKDGYEGLIKKHPVEEMSQFVGFLPPDPISMHERGMRRDWNELREEWKRQYEKGEPVRAYGERLFERVHFLMGYENMMVKLAEGDPLVEKVIGMVLQHNMAFINKVLEVGHPDVMYMGDDLGTQLALMINPDMWRRYFKPGYRAAISACRAAGTLVSLHSDGNLVEILDDLVEIGVSMLNCQVSVIGIDTVAKKLRGRICISADIDRQGVLPFGTPKDVRDHVREIVMKLGSPQGGLELEASMAHDVPFENISALLDAIKEYRYYWCQ